MELGRQLCYLVSFFICLCQIQPSLAFQQDTTTQTLVVSNNPNGGGIQVVDPNTNKQVINTNGKQTAESEDVDDQMEEQVVRGLLEWLEEKKKKKKDKKRPTPLPWIKPEKVEKKVIHIHINNHIKKKDNHKKHGHKKHGHYEDYHDGHYEHDYHDKHYHGKHSYPLLGHHHHWDYYGGHGGDHHGGDYGHGHGHDDDYGHESKKVEVTKKDQKSAKKRKDKHEHFGE